MTDEQTPAEDMPFEADDASQEIEALKLEVASLKDQALRYAAEAENTKRRAEREMNDARAYAIQKFARDLLGVADNLSRATATARATRRTRR
jgi:molecular chaperone GrpE